MAERLLPLFPLHVVVFPHTRLPLHIFEERYKLMVGNALRDHSEFGIVLARDNGISNTGCTVIVERVLQMYPDGRMDIVTHGQRRFEIHKLDEDQEYLQAEVEFFDDDDFAPLPDELREQALTHYNELAGTGIEPPFGEPDLKDPQLSFQLAQGLPDLDFLSLLLRNRSEAARLQELNHYLDDYIPRRRGIERMRELAPTNGHGATPKNI